MATSREEGIRLAREHHPDAVTLDMMMPEMDDSEFLDMLRRNAA